MKVFPPSVERYIEVFDTYTRSGFFGIDSDHAEVPAASPDAMLVVAALPCGAGIVGAIQAAILGIDDRVHAIVFAAGDSDADAAQTFTRQAAGELRPVIAAVGGFIKTAARPIRGGIDVPWRTPRLPQRGIDGLAVLRIESKIDRAGIIVLMQYRFPRLAAISRLKTPRSAFGP